MPELPEVETTRRGIAPHIEGQLVSAMVVRQAKLRWPVDSALVQATNFKIHRLERRAKYLIFDTDRGLILSHLGMSGSFRLTEHGEAPQKHDHIDWLLQNGRVLRYRDPRRFGCLFSIDSRDHALLRHLAPEPLSDAFDPHYLHAALKTKSSPIKNAIMDQRYVVGVGNIYASESLHRAGIDPKKPAKQVRKKALVDLVAAIKGVLHEAIEQGGTTLRDFVGGDGQPGYFAQSLAVYGRDGEPCGRCGGRIEKSLIGQRSSYFCRQCQR